MPSELDRRYDAALDAMSGENGPFKIGHDSQGRAIVENLPASVSGLLRASCHAHGSTEALIADGERLTFADLDTLSERVATALVAGCGIEKGDRIAIAMRNCPSWIITYMAALKAGAIATLVNGWWQSGELRHALDLTEPKLVIADGPRGARLAAGGCTLPTIVLDVDAPAEQALAPLLAHSASGTPLPDVAPEDDATILFTSGSTGISKGAVSTHRAVTTAVYAYALGLAATKRLIEQEGRAPGTPKTLVNVPLFHVTGEVPVLLNSFVVGRTMVLMKRWDAGEAMRLIERERITYFVGVPTMSLEMMQHPDRDAYDLSSLTDIAAGGAARPVDHVDRLRDAFGGAQPALGYGLTETNAVGCSNFWSNYADKPASTGRAHRPFVELAILGSGDSHLPAGERGEIGIRTAANLRGYWRNSEATAAAFTADDYVRTGDIGYLDDDGYLFIVDRKKDIIIRGGENIASQEVEAAVYAHPGVSEAAVFGVPDERLGEVPAAVVWSEQGIGEAELRAFLEQRLARFKVPAHVWLTGEPLPKLGTGKIDRVALREAYAARVAARV